MNSNQKILDALLHGGFQGRRKAVEMLEENIHLEGATKRGVSENALVKRFMKKVTHPDLQGYIEEDGRFYICDGFRFIELDSVPNLQRVQSQIRPSDLIDKSSTTPLEIDYKDCMGKLAVAIARKDVAIELDGAFFNPQYLQDVLKLYGESCKVFSNSVKTAPYYFESGGLTAMLLPIRVKEKESGWLEII